MQNLGFAGGRRFELLDINIPALKSTSANKWRTYVQVNYRGAFESVTEWSWIHIAGPNQIYVLFSGASAILYKTWFMSKYFC